MGTSSARRGPTTGLWRAAKGAATRYLSPGAGGEVSAREVVSRYLAALEETPGQGEALAAFRFTRKVAQDLGAFWDEVKARGLSAAAPGPAEMAASGVSGVLAGSGGGLEEAVVRTSLALVVGRAVSAEEKPDPAQLVRQFLATAVRLRLALDLGEPLEATAGGYLRLRDGLNRIQTVIEAGAAAAGSGPDPPATPVHWRGLTGWTWVTEIMAGLMKNLK